MISHSTPRMAVLFRHKPKPPEAQRELPLTFVEVDPETAVIEPPKDAKYYSSKNSLAANPEPAAKEVPKVDGKQDQVARLMDNEKPKPFPLQPSPPEPKPEEFVQPKPKSDAPGDLALKKPDESNEAPPPKPRPRTVAEARAAKGLLIGPKMRQDGGVERRGHIEAFNVKATPFGAYDAAFIAAVEQCWHNLLEDNQISQRSGKVVLEFKLNSDGRITDMKMQGNEVGEILGMLCQRSIELPAPYPRWPTDMRRVIGSNSREIRFTFFYN
jgi:hypothetical protein